jgi:hypothetical protein
MVDQVNVHEHPALADLGAGDFSGLGFALQGHGMNPEQFGGFLQVEGFHGCSGSSET